jgi:hypothetical protein
MCSQLTQSYSLKNFDSIIFSKGLAVSFVIFITFFVSLVSVGGISGRIIDSTLPHDPNEESENTYIVRIQNIGCDNLDAVSMNG